MCILYVFFKVGLSVKNQILGQKSWHFYNISIFLNVYLNFICITFETLL